MPRASASFSRTDCTAPERVGDGLAERLRNGDPQAMDEFCDSFGPVIFAIAMRIVRNPTVAEDLVQETFIRIWTSIGSFDSNRGSFSAWIATVARNRMLDYLRSSDFRTRHTTRDLRHADRRAAPPGERVDEADVIPRELSRAMSRLESNHRLVIELAFIEGLTQNEIAGRIHRPLGTVKAWSRSAIRTLREDLLRIYCA